MWSVFVTWGTEEAKLWPFCGLSIVTFHTFTCLWACDFGFGVALQLVKWLKLYEIFFFLFLMVVLLWVVSFSWCLWSLALCEAQIGPVSCLVNCLYNYINNLLTISSFTLCYMHLVLWRNLNIFLTNYFNGLGHWLFGSGHGSTRFFFRSKNSGSGWVRSKNSDPFCHV